MAEELIGYVSVDSGTLALCDPCYLRDGVIDVHSEQGYQEHVVGPGLSPASPVHQIGDGSWRSALIVSGWGGDGIFPVYVEKDESGMMTSIRIAISEWLWDGEDGKGVRPFQEHIVDARR